MTALVAVAPAAIAAAVGVAVAGGWRAGAARRRLRAGRSPAPARPAPAWLERAVDRAAVPVPAAVVGRGWVLGVAAAAATGLVVAGPVAAVVAAVLATAAPAVALLARRHRRARLAEAALPDALEAVASALRGGGSLLQALDDVGRRADPAARELARVAAEAAAGLGVAAALTRWAASDPGADRRLAAAALLVGLETGAPPGRAVDGVAATLRERRAVGREAHAQAAQARASVALLVAAPLVFAVAASAVDPRVGGFLVGSPLGLACLGAGVLLDGLGAWWMRALVRGPGGGR